MLIYSTRFRVAQSFGKNRFISSIVEWNQNGQYPIDGIETDSYSFIAGDDNNYIETNDLEEESVIAARMHIENNGGTWNTDLILNYGENVLSVYVNRTVSESTGNPSARAYVPQFVTQIINGGCADTSMGIPISSAAVQLSDRNAILGSIKTSDRFSLPMVYLSSRSKINADLLAAKLAGLATVVTDDSDSIAEEYPEPIYVFFPHRNMTPAAFGPYPFHRDIQACVVNYLNGREYRKLETWDGIQNTKTDIANRKLLLRYKTAASENESLVEMYSELEEKIAQEAQLRDKLSCENNMLLAENARLQQENQRLKGSGVRLLSRGAESDLYDNEQYEIIMAVLREYLAKSVAAGTRRADILRSVIEANPANGTPEKFRAVIKSALDGYKYFDSSKITKALRETGIEIIEHTGHYKIALGGDSRYTCEAAATCSDSRGGLNLTAEISKTMF